MSPSAATHGRLAVMPEPSDNHLTEDAVRKVAHLSRLAIGDEQIPRYTRELSTVLEHIEKLQSLDVEGVEPMAHPRPVHNRLDEDIPVEGMNVETLLQNAPAVKGEFIAVPKVLGEGS